MNNDLIIQRKNIVDLYDNIANIYDQSFESKADYQIPEILLKIYKKYRINNGSILDIGCGTGKLREYLGNNFTYEGVDISPNMIKEAEKRGYSKRLGPIEDIIFNIEDKSIDHVVAMSSLYFIRDFENLTKEFERVARKSIFISLEQFDAKTIEMMKEKGINIYNHSLSLIQNPTEIIENVFLWKSPTSDNKIYGDIIFKEF